MARQPRIEVEGGLYHIIARGNDRQDVFHTAEHHGKFLSLLAAQKARMPFFLYAYCLMTNHFHLLIERREHSIGAIMQRVLTGYSQWHNRRHRRVGHVFQGRHKSILCQSETYLAELVRYIHLNPVRAGMVELPEDYPHSSHRAYLGLEPDGIVDVDPVLRHFGAQREAARAGFREHVAAGMGVRYPVDFDSPAGSGVLGSEEFRDEAIHRIGASAEAARARGKKVQSPPFDAAALVASVEAVFGVPVADLRSRGKSARAVAAKEALILAGREAGATVTLLAELAGLDTSTTSRRCDAALTRSGTDTQFAYALRLVRDRYAAKIAELQA